MKIECFTIAWNEEDFLPQYIDYYSQFADKITVFDNESTDRTVAIAESRGCEVVHFNSDGEQKNEIMLDIKANCWKESKADWVIVGDVDEILWHHDTLVGHLSKTDCTVMRSIGYQMVSEEFRPYHEIKTGARYRLYDKCICFKPQEISDMGWVMGCHYAYPVGNVKLSFETRLLHYHLIGRQRVLDRYNRYAARMSAKDKENRWGWQYLQTDEEKLKDFEDAKSKAVPCWD